MPVPPYNLRIMASITNQLQAWRGQIRPGVLLALLATYIIWGTTYLGIRFVVEAVPPFLMAGSRFLFAGVILFAILRARGQRMPGWRAWGSSAIVALFMLGGGMGLVAYAEALGVSSSLAAALIATVPLWSAIFARWLGRKVSRRDWIGILVGFGGVALLNLEGDLRANPLGAVALFLSPLFWALGSQLSHRLEMPEGEMGTATEMLCGSVLLLGWSALSGERIPDLAAIPWSAWAAWIYLIVFGSLIAFSAYMYLLRNVRPALATSYAYVNPLVALGAGFALANERVSWIGLIGIGVILGAVAFIALSRVERDDASHSSS